MSLLPNKTLVGWPFIGRDGKQRWITGFNPPGVPSLGDPGLRLFVEAEPLWVVEADYPIDTDLWAPSFADPGRGQSPEVTGPDELGRYFVAFSTHDMDDVVGPTNFGSYGKLVVAEIGRPDSAVVVSRKQNHQTQTEPELMILNGKLQVIYSETETGPFRTQGEGQVRQRYLDLGEFALPQ